MSDAVQVDLVTWLDEHQPSAAPTTGLRSHALWPTLREYLRVETTGRHTRLELRDVPASLAADALTIHAPCVACGALVQPVRSRRPPGNKRRDNPTAALYLAVTCTLAQRLGCSRGKAASAEYAAIKAEVTP